MIKPINISHLNTTFLVYYECESCGTKGKIKLGHIINVDKKSDLEELNLEVCPECEMKLGSSSIISNNNSKLLNY